MMTEEKPRIVYVDCPQCHEVIKLELHDLVFNGDYAKIVYTHGTFGINPHSVIIDLDKNYSLKQVTVADITFTKVG